MKTDVVPRNLLMLSFAACCLLVTSNASAEGLLTDPSPALSVQELTRLAGANPIVSNKQKTPSQAYEHSIYGPRTVKGVAYPGTTHIGYSGQNPDGSMFARDLHGNKVIKKWLVMGKGGQQIDVKTVKVQTGKARPKLHSAEITNRPDANLKVVLAGGKLSAYRRDFDSTTRRFGQFHEASDISVRKVPTHQNLYRIKDHRTGFSVNFNRQTGTVTDGAPRGRHAVR